MEQATISGSQPIDPDRLDRRKWLGWALFALTLGMAAASVYMFVWADAPSEEGLLALIIVPAPLLIGLALTYMRPGNVIGLLLLAHAALLTVHCFTNAYAYTGLIGDPGSLPGADWAALWNTIDWPVFYAGLVATILVFPNGRLPSPRWRRVAIGALVSFSGLIIGLAVYPEPMLDPFGDFERPLPTLSDGAPPLFAPFWLGTLASLFAAAWAIRVRFRGSFGAERLQLLWLAYGALAIPTTLLICVLDYVLTGEVGTLTAIALVIMEIAIPVSIGVAILRYRLFDIELVLSRTLVYGFLTGSVILVYVAVVGGLNTLVNARGILGLIATGVVAIGIQPLRQRVQTRVNRMVFGDRDDPYAALSRLGDRLQATLAPGAVTASIVETVAEALRASYVAVEFERDGDLEVIASHGSPSGRGAESTPLAYQGQPIGRLTVEAPPGRDLTNADRRLLDDLGRQAGVALHGVRLTADLQYSRERLVSAREEERRRLRRDLHDSLGPTLAGMAFRLDAAHNLIATDPEGADRMIRELREETQDAIGDIRRVAHELRPPALDELGLVPAIQAYAERLNGNGSGVSVQIDSPEPLPDLPAAVEVAAYRIVLEALTNVSKHARATSCHVALDVNSSLHVAVTDDGVGLGSRIGTGVGLASMRERAAELGGQVELSSRVAGGTRVTATLPLAADS